MCSEQTIEYFYCNPDRWVHEICTNNRIFSDLKNPVTQPVGFGFPESCGFLEWNDWPITIHPDIGLTRWSKKLIHEYV